MSLSGTQRALTYKEGKDNGEKNEEAITSSMNKTKA
jgi:hypothetical protein